MKDISTIFFPAADVFTVIGSNNESYWINCITRLEYLQGSEHVVHVNLLIIFTNYTSLIQIGLYCQMVLILYESKKNTVSFHFIYDYTGLAHFPVPHLNIIRLTGFNLSFLFCGAVFAERLCATRFVIDYERNVGVYISIILNLATDVFSILIAALIVKGVLNGYYLSLVALFPNPFYCLLFHKMIKRNERHLSSLNELGGAKTHDTYTLSLRVQLKENIWSMQKIESVLYLLTGFLACDLLFVFLPPLFLDKPQDLRDLQWFTVAANIVDCRLLVAAISMAFHSYFLPADLKRLINK
ncbi:hypothetical protein PRIPAC_91457, partial [Pristionchus pacificus]|uniref:G protein-coupled receptor n=1 Tax=Pristionchus pacificus TaxID=54126 RepID=A0A2A6CGQ8_PRIPA